MRAHDDDVAVAFFGRTSLASEGPDLHRLFRQVAAVRGNQDILNWLTSGLTGLVLAQGEGGKGSTAAAELG